MCGIAGASLAPDENLNARTLATALLLGIEERGRHATGVAFFEDGQPYVQKANIPAADFVGSLDMAEHVTNLILHTCWATKGRATNNANNHPIDVQGVIGVHNGVIYNDDDLFARIQDITGTNKRIAQVDSEAIFSTILHGQEKAPQALARVDGSAAVAWLESYGDPDLQHVSRVSSSPVIFAFTEAGSMIWASTETAVRRGLHAVGLNIAGGPYRLEEGVYLRVRQGEIVTRLAYTPHGKDRTLSETERRALNLI